MQKESTGVSAETGIRASLAIKTIIAQLTFCFPTEASYFMDVVACLRCRFDSQRSSLLSKSCSNNRALQGVVDVNMWLWHGVDLGASDDSTVSRKLRADTH